MWTYEEWADLRIALARQVKWSTLRMGRNRQRFVSTSLTVEQKHTELGHRQL